VLEESGEDQLDRLCENENMLESRRGEEYLAYSKRRKANWIGHILHGTACLLKHVIEGKVEGEEGKASRCVFCSEMFTAVIYTY
jgi:hypothetical protein